MSDSHDPSMSHPPPQAVAVDGARGLTQTQRRFLRALEFDCDPTSPPARILAKLPLATLAEWLLRPAFRARLDQLLEMIAKKRRITLQMASGRAAERLEASFDETTTLTSDQRRTCLELVKLVEGRGSAAGSAAAGAKSESSAQVRPARTADSAQSSAPREISSPANLAHPDVPPEEARELVQKLEP